MAARFLTKTHSRPNTLRSGRLAGPPESLVKPLSTFQLSLLEGHRQQVDVGTWSPAGLDNRLAPSEAPSGTFRAPSEHRRHLRGSTFEAADWRRAPAGSRAAERTGVVGAPGCPRKFASLGIRLGWQP